MHQYTDSLGRAWSVSITAATVKRVRGALDGLDLYKVVETGLVELNDPCRLVEVLWVICEKQAKAAGIDPEGFAEGLGGDSLARAAEAFMSELVDFFPDPRVREALGKMMKKQKEVQALAGAQAVKAVEAIDPASLLATLNERSGSVPASAASTPAP